MSFDRWERFDADAAEAEIERQANVRDAIRERISLERRVLKECEDRAATLKSEAAVRALKAKRGSRRRGANRHARPASSAVNPGAPLASAGPATDPDIPIDCAAVGSSGDVGRAQADANEAEAIVAGLKRGMALRDEVLASVGAGDLYKGVTKARECLSKLGALQSLLCKACPATVNRGQPPFTVTGDACRGNGNGGSDGEEGGRRHGGSKAHDHSHSHPSPRAHAHAHSHEGCCSNTRDVCRMASSASDAGGVGGGDGGEKVVGGNNQHTLGAREGSLVGAAEIVRKATIAVRMAEGTCLLRTGRAAQATQALRDLLLEHPTSVEAWIARGRAFLSMQNKLLAGLHFDRALELDPDSADAAELKNSFRLNLDTAEHGGGDSDVGETSPSSSGILPNRESHGRKEREWPSAASPCVTEGEEAKMTGEPGDRSGASQEDELRHFLATACEEYRAGVVLHQEAFFASSRDKFYRVLSLIDEAEGAAGGPSQAEEREWEPNLGARSLQNPGLMESAGGCTPNTGCASRNPHIILNKVRIGCHLNIAAAGLLKKTEYESVVHHCSRALAIASCNSSRALERRALVRRAQAHEELGRFRLAVDDLEAAMASLLEEAREAQPRGQSEGPGKALEGEKAEITKRLERARWTKIHVGNGKDELPKVGGPKV